MNRLISYFVKYPIWANVLMFAILIMGYFSFNNLHTSFFPEGESNRINISISYPGTSPEEIEESVILKIEQLLRGIPGIDRTTSTSSENRGSILIELIDDYDVELAYRDIKNTVDRMSPYPSGAEQPKITIQKSRSRSVNVALFGDADLWALKERATLFRDELLQKEGVSQVTLLGMPQREISITISEDNLRKYNLTFAEIASKIALSNRNITAGQIKSDEEMILIRSYNKKNQAYLIENIVLVSSVDGGEIRVKDIATVKEQWEDTPNATYYNGKRAVLIYVDKTSEEDIIEISEAVKELLPTFNERYPEVKLVITSDGAKVVKQRVELLTSNGLIGFLLVLLVLGIFLNTRLAFWVALGIPISFAGMFIIADLYGITINVLSLMGMIIVIGILVDDAIVVAENIYQKHEEGMSAYKAAMVGLMEVIPPVFTAVATTILAFLPFFFLVGRIGSVVDELAVVVIGALIFSLVESFLILPAHLAHSKAMQKGKKPSKIRQKFDKFIKWWTEKVYGSTLRFVISNPFFFLALAIGIGAITYKGLIGGKHVQRSAFPYIAGDNTTINLTMPAGTDEAITNKILIDIEDKIWQVNEKLKKTRQDGRDVIEVITRTIGSSSGASGGHTGSLRIDFLDGEIRNLDDFVIVGMLRKEIGVIPEVQDLSFSAGRWGKAVSISLTSNSIDALNEAKIALKERLKNLPELKDITDTDREGLRELRLELKPAAFAANLTAAEIMEQIRDGFFGRKIQSIQRGEDDIELWLRYSDQDRSSVDNLENIYIRDKRGNQYLLKNLVQYTIDRGIVEINHLDGKREVKVEASKSDPKSATSGIIDDIKSNVLPEIKKMHPNVMIKLDGRARGNAKFEESLQNAFIPALLAIVFLLVLVFRSKGQAFIIMLMIPLGVIGAVWGHLFHDFHLSRLSTFGIIALVGIVINDSIVFIDQINRNLRNGITFSEAVYLGGISRLRPIILTTVTTVAGMAPLLAEGSRQAKFLQPMAASLTYGLLFGSFFILVVLPSLVVILNYIRYYIHQFGQFCTRYDYLQSITELIEFFFGEIPKKVTRESVEPSVKELQIDES